MLLKTILNRLEKYSSFVFENASFCRHYDDWTFGEEVIVVDVRPRANGDPTCSGCGKRRPGYDHLERRLFEYVPLWGIKVFFAYLMRRVDCSSCGVIVENVPWAEGKKQITKTYEWFLAIWASRLSWSVAAQVFRTSWDTVFRAVEMAVDWGLHHRDLTGITAIGIDEISRRKAHTYLTLVYQIDKHCKRLIWIGEDRKEKTLRRFFRWFGEARTSLLEAVCSDMWKPYLKVVEEYASQAIHVLDRFHIMSHMNKAIDKVRADEHRRMKREGYDPVLTKTRWLLLRRAENLSESQETKLRDLLRYNLRSVRAYLLKEDFQAFWKYVSPAWAGKFLDRWCRRAMRSRIEPMKEVACTLRKHRELILNWFRVRGEISQGIVEGFNNKAKVTARNSYGFRTTRVAKVALYHRLGDLPIPEWAHRYC